MPNYVYTKAIVSGPEEDIEQMKSACFFLNPGPDQDGIDFDRVWPIPDPVPPYTMEMLMNLTVTCLLRKKIQGEKPTEEEIQEAGSFADKMLLDAPDRWWCNYNWGCDGRLFTSTYKDGQIYLVTAWNGPLGIFKKIVERFPTLSFDIRSEEEQGAFFEKGTISFAGVDLAHDKDAEASWELDGKADYFDLDGRRYHEETAQ